MSKGNTVVYKDGTFTAEAPMCRWWSPGRRLPEGHHAGNLNLLTALRRIEYSADGEATAYVLPEEAIGVTAITVDNVSKDVAASGSFDLSKHTYTFTTAPIKGVANVEFTYTTDAAKAAENRLKILGCPLAEAYNGATDTRLFVAGRDESVLLHRGSPVGRGDGTVFPRHERGGGGHVRLPGDGACTTLLKASGIQARRRIHHQL